MTRRNASDESTHLKQSLSLLSATIESAMDGILVVDRQGKILTYNRKFLTLWCIPETVAASSEDRQLWSSVLDQLKFPECFLERVAQIYADPEGESFDTLEFRDGKVLERYSLPQRIGEESVGRVWSFRDVTVLRRAVEEQRRDREVSQRLAEERSILAEIGRLISSTLDIAEVYERVAAEASKLIPFDRLMVNLNRPQENEIHIAYATGLEVPGRGPGDVLPLRGGINDRLIQTRVGLIIRLENLKAAIARFPLSQVNYDAGLRTVMSVPLITRDKVIGGLHFHTRQENAYTEQDLRLAERIGDQIAGAIANARLFEDLQKTERSLRESEELYSRLIASMPDYVIRTDAEGRLQFINEMALRQSGYDRPEMIGQNVLQFIAPEDHERFLKYLLLMFEHRVGPQEYLIVMKDGRKVPFEVNGDILRNADGSPYGLVIVCRNISERKKAEEVLRRQNAYLEALHETTLGLIRRMDLTELFQAIVNRATRLSGADEGWVAVYDPQRGDSEYKASVGQSVCRVGVRFETGRGIAGEVWRTGKPVILDDYQKWPKQAPVQDYALRRATMAIPMRSEGRLAGVLGLAHYDQGRRFGDEDLAMLERFAELASIALDNARLYDQMTQELTERKRLEAEHTRMQAQLLQSQKMEAIGTLAGGIAHDFNNILGIIIGYADLALYDASEGTTVRTRLAQVLKAAQRARDLVNQILAFGRKQEQEKRPLVLAPLVKEVIKMLRSSLPATIRIRQYIRESNITVWADPTQIHQVLMNLCTNAAHAMREQGGILTIDLDQGGVDLAAGIDHPDLVTGDYAILTVKDTGHGIDPSIRERIFDPFFTTKKQGEGTGLGLSVVYGIVKDCGGAVDVSSESGQGTSFRVWLPMVETGQAEEETFPEPEPGGRKRILLVDDEADLADVGASILVSLGHEVVSETSSVGALKRFCLRPEAFDLVITDMTMPRMTGVDLAGEMLKARPDIPIILCTGFSEAISEEKARSVGIRRLVMKPLFRKDLVKVIREVCPGEPKNGASPETP